MSEGEYGDLMTTSMQVLYASVIGVLVTGEERTTDLATVGVCTLTVEDFVVQVNVVNINGTVKGDGDHLRNVGWFKSSGNASSVSRAETIGKNTLRLVTIRSTIGIQFNGCKIQSNFSNLLNRIHESRILNTNVNLLQAFSSDSSLQSGFPLQKSSLSIHSPLPQDNLPSGHTGSSVLRIGRILRGSEIMHTHTYVD